MLRRRHRRSTGRLFPTLGVAGLLVLGGIGYVSYTANSGLPLKDSYEVTVEVPSANRLTDTNEVRIGGTRVGQVASVSAVPARGSGRPYARLELTLEPSGGPLPIDSTAKVRSASVLGATYVDLTLGRSPETLAEGGTLPLRQAAPTVELTDLFAIFEGSAARNFQDAVSDLGTGFAGRGAALNSTIGSLSTLLPPLTEVTRVLAAPETRLGDFLHGYERTFAAIEPVRDELGGLVSNGATTFDALARERDALAEAIEAAPPAESAVTAAFERVRPALDGLADIVADLQPAGQILPAALDESNATLLAGVRPLRQLPGFSRHLRTTLVGLHALSRERSTSGALRKLTDLMSASDELLEKVAPAQVHCNAFANLLQGLSSQFGDLGVGHGPSISNIAFKHGGAENEALQNREPSPNAAINYLAVNDAEECESGNEPYDGTQRLSSPAGPQASRTKRTAPPPGARERAREAGLLEDPEGIR